MADDLEKTVSEIDKKRNAEFENDPAIKKWRSIQRLKTIEDISLLIGSVGTWFIGTQYLHGYSLPICAYSFLAGIGAYATIWAFFKFIIRKESW